MKRAIIVGGGISGIAAASRLIERGIETVLLESELALGGRIGTRVHGTTEIDLGGRNFSANDSQLLQVLGIFGVSVLSDYHFNSVAVGIGRGFDTRSGGGPLTRTKRLLGNAISVGPRQLRTLAKVVSGARQGAGAHLLCSPYWIRLARDVGDPVVTSYFGNDVANKLFRPWTLRAMAAEPEEVYLGNLGPMLGRRTELLKRVQGGMGIFLRAASARLNVKFGHKVKAISLVDNRVVGVEGLTMDGSPFCELADLVVVATPAHIAADLVEAMPNLARTLRQIVYHPVATIVAEYSDVHFEGDVGGLFTPRGYAASHIAKYDDNNRIRFSFAGVAARKAMAECSVEELLDLGEKTFREFDGKLGKRISFIGEIWRPGLCAQTWRHHETVCSISAQCDRLEGLVLTGDYVRGNSLEACATAAHENIERTIQPHDHRNMLNCIQSVESVIS